LADGLAKALSLCGEALIDTVVFAAFCFAGESCHDFLRNYVAKQNRNVLTKCGFDLATPCTDGISEVQKTAS
jgi:hypothetical protein